MSFTDISAVLECIKFYIVPLSFGDEALFLSLDLTLIAGDALLD